MQGATSVAFTVLDVLGYLDEIPVCVAYELDGKRIDSFPSTAKLKHCKPVIETLLPAGSATSAELKIMRICPKIPANTLNLQKKKSGFRST